MTAIDVSNPSILDEPILLSIECDEPDGKITRNVRFMKLSRDNLRRLWEESKKFNTLFTEEINQDFKKFIELFIHQVGDGIESNGLFFVVDDFVGVFYMTRIVPGIDAMVHYSFFDRRHKGRENLVKEMLAYGFNHYGFLRLSTEVPLYVTRNTFIFVESLGFKKEGRIRKAAFYKNEWFDINLYGILREEVILDGNKS